MLSILGILKSLKIRAQAKKGVVRLVHGGGGSVYGDTFLFFYFFGGLEFIGHSFAYVAHFVFRFDSNPKRAAVASRRAASLATHSRPSPCIEILSIP